MTKKLSEYNKKRKFEETPEPKGEAPKKAGRLFVIQKHDASHLHYDFRLEHDGALLSWAVPKGPSLDPATKRLAVHVEDHPVSYGHFEGTIPEGHYGAGTVLVWDEGSWEPTGDVDEMMKEGSLKFRLHGKRLQGLWALIRLKDQEKNWLLIKDKDEFAEPGDEGGIVERYTSSVLSEPRAKKSTLDYRSFRPQLATPTNHIPEGDQWIHEVKFDGYRILGWRTKDGVHLITRSGQDWTHKFKKIAEALNSLDEGTGVDGEIVVFNKQGQSDFGALQAWLKDGKGTGPVYMTFDLIASDGEDISRRPLNTRKEKLEAIVKGLPKKDQGWIRYSDHLVGDAKSLAKEACLAGLEGLISKDIDAPYVQTRTRSWMKTKCVKQEEFVIGGYSKPSGERHGFGALLLGQFDPDGHLQYTGKVGTGFVDRDLKDLLKLMQSKERATSPFALTEERLPPVKSWVKPELVVQIRYGERTKTGMIRHGVFLGMREDKKAKEVTPEVPVQELSVTITHPERVLFPEENITKLQLAEYYNLVGDRMMPFVSDRPLALVRCPEGVTGSCFFQKHLSAGMSKTLETKVKGEDEPLIRVKDKEGILRLVQFGVVEIHAWGCHVQKIEEPDMMVFDLDPGPKVSWKTVLEATEVMGEYVRSLGLKPFAKISGGKGFHVVVPIQAGSLGWPAFKALAKGVAQSLDEMVPGQFVTVSTKAIRDKKIFIDYLRNGRGATSVVPYGVRNHPEASVSVPITWEELKSIESPKQYRVSNVTEWLKPESEDPWRDFAKSTTKVPEDIWDNIGIDKPAF